MYFLNNDNFKSYYFVINKIFVIKIFRKLKDLYLLFLN